MSTSYSSNLKLGTPAANDSGWSNTLDRNRGILDALTPIGALAVTTTEVPSASLNVAVSAGKFANATGTLVSYAGTASQAIATASTKYLYLDNGGTLQVASAFPAATAIVPLAVVVAGASTITSVTDARAVLRTVNL
jgi:hypothetical protein